MQRFLKILCKFIEIRLQIRINETLSNLTKVSKGKLSSLEGKIREKKLNKQT